MRRSNRNVIVLATPWEAVPEIVFSDRRHERKIPWTCTNPIRPNPEWPCFAGDICWQKEIGKAPSRDFRVVKALQHAGCGKSYRRSF